MKNPMELRMISEAAHRRRTSFPSGNGGSKKGRCRCGVTKIPLSPPVGVKIVVIVILLKNPMNASTKLSMNGKTPMISTAPPFVPSINSGQALRLSKDERRVFQQNQNILSAKRYRSDEATGPASGRLRERVAAIAVFVLIVDFV